MCVSVFIIVVMVFGVCMVVMFVVVGLCIDVWVFVMLVVMCVLYVDCVMLEVLVCMEFVYNFYVIGVVGGRFVC